MKLQRGYSFIEVIFAISICALLAGLALPNYRQMVRKSRRSEAIALLLELQVRQEKWRADNPAYATTPAQIGAPASGDVVTYYTLSIPGATATSYSLRALANGSGGQSADTQNGVSCAELDIDQSGTRTPDVCWTR